MFNMTDIMELFTHPKELTKPTTRKKSRKQPVTGLPRSMRG